MLSDAADEGSRLTRAFDDEETDTSRVQEELALFVHRIRVLFLEKKATTQGFTTLALQQLTQVLGNVMCMCACVHVCMCACACAYVHGHVHVRACM